MTGTVIVGAGQAGAQTAFSLREFGYTAPITIVGAEVHQPYQRPPLSKAFLAGTADPQSLLLRKKAFYDKLEIDVRSGCTVRDAELAGDRGAAHLATGETVPFDRLVLAVGGRPRRLEVPGSDLEGVMYLRTIDDAMTICGLLGRSNSVVVIGGGFIGLEVAAAARARDAAVTVVEVAPRLLSRALAPDMSEFLRDAHEMAGVTFHFGAAVTAMEGDGEHVRKVFLSDGSQIEADAVVVGVGLEPHLELAERLGLQTDGGIVVDLHSRTSDHRVLAAGDCTVMPNPVTGSGLVRLESVQNAVEQAKAAAATIAGKSAPYVAVPWFWSNQGNLKIQMVGLTTEFDRVEIRGHVRGQEMSAFYFRAGRLCAVHAVNRPKDFMQGRKALTQNLAGGPDSDSNEAAPLTSVPAGTSTNF